MIHSADDIQALFRYYFQCIEQKIVKLAGLVERVQAIGELVQISIIQAKPWRLSLSLRQQQPYLRY